VVVRGPNAGSSRGQPISKSGPRETVSGNFLRNRVRRIRRDLQALGQRLSRARLGVWLPSTTSGVWATNNHRRVSKLYPWEEKKSKTSWGGQGGLREDCGGCGVRMKTADLHRFLGVCALFRPVFPGYNPKQSLAKDSNCTYRNR